MKSVLVGNGINIQFGGKAYSSQFIMKRIKFKSKLEMYDKLFEGTIRGEEIYKILNAFVDITNDTLDGKYDNYIKNEETKIAVNDFKNRYKKVSEPHEIMVEDWFLILHLFFLKNSDLKENAKAAKVGFERLILDGIYNDGRLQEVHEKMGRKVRKFFRTFNNIFTLNYDNNLEKLTGKEVYHLHGDFSVLAHTENPNYVYGYINNIENNIVTIEGMEHCFCNALLNYSGFEKLKVAEANDMLCNITENYHIKYKEDMEFRNYVEGLKETDLRLYKAYKTKIENPHLIFATQYHFKKLECIEDELHIIGMSPNNDGHILEKIKNNNKLKKVYFYYYCQEEKEIIEKLEPKGLYIPLSIKDLWNDLDANKPQYNVKYKLPNEIDSFINAFSALSEDKVTKDDVLYEAKGIPEFEAIRLCKLVKEKLQKNSKKESITEEEFNIERYTISYIALREGVLPATLLMLYTIYLKKYRL